MRRLARLLLTLTVLAAFASARAADYFPEAQIAGLLPQRPGVVDLYLVLVGADGEEAVFAREVATVRKLFDTRFDTRGRSIQMVNSRNPHAPAEATVDHLARVLEGVGRVIDRDEDIVFVHITTHGSERHQLWFNHGGRDLVHLEPPALKKMLDAAGIKNRVLVISACYSGGFIRPLADANTMILTAAEATRQSYGCGNDSLITEFSRAFYDRGLRATYSFESAFRFAQDAVYKDERERGYVHSNPQMFLGADIKPRLIMLHKRLAARR